MNFNFDIKPVPYARPRFGRNKQVFDPPNYSAFKTALRFQATHFMRGVPKFNKPIKINLEFYKNNKNLTSQNWGDLDNHCKAVLDALQTVVFTNDAQIVQLNATKNFAKNEKIVVNIEEVLP